MATVKKEQIAKRMKKNRRKTDAFNSTIKTSLSDPGTTQEGGLPIMKSAYDEHHKKMKGPRKTIIKLEGVKIDDNNNEDDPLTTIENIKKAIAGIEETVKRTGIYSKAAKRRKNDLLRELQLAQLSLIPVINVKPCSKPVLIEARSTSAIFEFKTPKLRLRCKTYLRSGST